ncbi:GSCFA domain-containing protein [Flavobacterium sp.]|uniref:GSCFA domain-containing protein n=1 Tax=Flavobacterium sp. TaxID=239 RepID=UPI002FDB87EC
MEFSTKVPIQSSNQPIDYSSRIVSLGSCFAENIGKKFDYFKFQNSVNPFGIIFNPVAIEKLIFRAVTEHYFTAEDLFFHNDLWHCYEVHSELSHPDREVLLVTLNHLLKSTHHQITESTHCLITYGTSWVYRLKASNAIVANCHKVPQNQFDKEILSVTTIEQSIQHTIDVLRKINPECHILFTVSPVRHIKDGFVENQRSKAHLISAIHALQQDYFPSYEILMDELRDYRFYAEDMLHPNQTAIDYIWQRFAETTISETSFPIMEEVDAIQKGLAHRAFNPDSDSHQKFLQNLNQKIIRLQEQFPHMQF